MEWGRGDSCEPGVEKRAVAWHRYCFQVAGSTRWCMVSGVGVCRQENVEILFHEFRQLKKRLVGRLASDW